MTIRTGTCCDFNARQKRGERGRVEEDREVMWGGRVGGAGGRGAGDAADAEVYLTHAHARTHSKIYALFHTNTLSHTRRQSKVAYPPSYRGHLGLPSVSCVSVELRGGQSPAVLHVPPTDGRSKPISPQVERKKKVGSMQQFIPHRDDGGLSKKKKGKRKSINLDRVCQI